MFKSLDDLKVLLAAPSTDGGGVSLNQSQILYVASNVGNDANSGLNINEPKLTITNAEAAAFALNPSATNQIVIKGVGAGDWAEDVDLREWIHLDFGDSSLDGTLDVADNCIVSFRRLQKTSVGGSVVKKDTGAGFAKVSVELLIVSDSTQNGFLLNSGVAHLDAGVLSVDAGIGIKAKNGSRVSFIVSEVQLLNGGTGIGTQVSGGDPNLFSGNVLYARDDGSGVLLKSKVAGDIINIQGGSFIVDTLFDMGANSTLNVFATEATGSVIEDPTATVNSVEVKSASKYKDTVNYYRIPSPDDFPNQDATKIYLDAGTTYDAVANFTTAKQFVRNGGNIIAHGLTGVAQITYTGTAPMFVNGTSNRGSLINIAIDCPSAKAFDLVGDGTNASRVDLDVVEIKNCINIGDFDDTNVIVKGFLRVPNITGTYGSLLKGSATTFNCDGYFCGGMTSGAIALDLGTATRTNVQVSDFTVIGSADAIAISGLTNSGNIVGGSLSILQSGFENLNTPLVGVSQFDPRSKFLGNDGIENSRVSGFCYLSGGATTVEIANTGDWAEVGTPSEGGVTIVTQVDHKLSISSSGVMTLDAANPVTGNFVVDLAGSKSGGGSNTYEVRLALEWDGLTTDSGIEGSRQLLTTASDPVLGIARFEVEGWQQGQTVRVIITNTTTGDDFIIHSYKFSFTEA